MQRLARLASLGCLSSLVFAGPAVAAPPDGCARSDHGKRYEAAARHVHRAGEVVRTVVVVCDRRTGQRAVVHRAIERRGDTVESAAAAGRRVAWIERHRGARASIEIVVIELPTRRRLRRLTVARRQVGQGRAIDLALTRRGDLAWLVPAGRRRDRLGLQPIGRPRQEIARARELSGLAVEDDRTLRWRQGRDGEFMYLDLRAPRVVDGCPRRERFRPVLSDTHVLVTSADYGAATPIDGIVWTVVRACLRAGGRDFVVAQDESSTGGSTSTALIRPSPPYLVLGREAADRHDCANAALQTVDLRSGRSRHSGALACDALPYTPAPLAVTSSGAPAWILDRADASRLLAITAGRGLIELDGGAPGSLRDLRAEADTVHWTHAGEPRAADLQ